MRAAVGTVRHIQNAIRKTPQPPFEAQSRIIKIPALHPRFAEVIEKSIPDADVVFATAWETAYTVSRLHEKKGRKYYFVQNYEIWDTWNDEDCWTEAKRNKRPDEMLTLAMADVQPKKRRQKATTKVRRRIAPICF